MGESKQVLTALIRVDRPMPCLDALTIPKRRQISSIALKKEPATIRDPVAGRERIAGTCRRYDAVPCSQPIVSSPPSICHVLPPAQPNISPPAPPHFSFRPHFFTADPELYHFTSTDHLGNPDTQKLARGWVLKSTHLCVWYVFLRHRTGCLRKLTHNRPSRFRYYPIPLLPLESAFGCQPCAPLAEPCDLHLQASSHPL